MAKDLYYTEKAALYSQDKSKTWQLINELSGRMRKKQTSVKCLKTKSGKKLEKQIDIANYLNEHFCSVGKTMASKLDNDCVDKLDIKDPLDYIPTKVSKSIFFQEVDPSEILKLI